jgi:hypothetical protein
MAKDSAANFIQSACRFGVKALVASSKFSSSGAMRDAPLVTGAAPGTG